MPTLAHAVDHIRVTHPHPSDSLIGSAADFVFAIRNNKAYRWSRTAADASAPCPALQWDRIGTNLYNHATGESWGAPIDVDGASHNKLTAAQLDEIRARLPDYVTLAVTSTSGTGLHLYVLWTAPVRATPDEHRLLGKRTALKLQADVGLAYPWIDVSTNILWTVARDKGEGAFQQLATGSRLNPATLPQIPPPSGRENDPPPDLDDASRLLMDRAKGTPYACHWVPDIGAIRLHKGLLSALQQHYPGNYQTDCPGRDPATANAWIRRTDDYWDVYAWGDTEHPVWDESPGGWMHTTFGRPPTWEAANAAGTPDSANSYRYSDPQQAVDAIRKLTGETLPLPDALQTPGRQWDVVRKGPVLQLRAHKLRTGEPCPSGWCDATKYVWTGIKPESSPAIGARVKRQFYQTRQDTKLTGLYRFNGTGRPTLHTREQAYSVARDLVGADATALIDQVTASPIELVSEAFRPILQPDKLNIGPQLAVTPAPGPCDAWMQMLLRLGDSLTPALTAGPWADWVRQHRVTSGGRYLLLWCAWMLQQPTQRVPALAFVGPKNTGKSTLGDALTMLMDKSGASDAGELLRKGSQFTGPVALSVLGRIEDQDISGRDKRDRLTPWVTAPKLLCEFKGQTPYSVDNQLHLMMTCNSPAYVPVYDDDCRFVVVEVGTLSPADRDSSFSSRLQAEAPAFLHWALNTQLPPAYDRLALPAIHTDAKADLAESNQSVVERFAGEVIEMGEPADYVSNAALYTAYREWCQRRGRPQTCDDAQALVKGLGEWFTNRGIASARTKTDRGRKGIRLQSI